MNPRPSEHLIAYWTEALGRHEPFSRMAPEHLQALVAGAREHYAPPAAVLLQESDGLPSSLCWVRQGTVIGYPLAAEHEAFELEAGSLWPVAALMAQRPVRSRYQAHDDCFYLSFPWALVQSVMARSLPLADHLQQQARSLLQASGRLLRQALQSRHEQEARLDTSLTSLPGKDVLCLPQEVSLRQALTNMQRREVGSVLLVAPSGELAGILTRHDLLDRVVLAETPLDSPAARVMSSPVHAIEDSGTLADAALSMARHGVRHLPIVHGGRVVNLVSERDLFALQRQTLRHVSALVQSATNLPELQAAAHAIRSLARHLLAQGSPPGLLTQLVSSLNDRLTRQIIGLTLETSGLSSQQMCWIALGSEGRHEQTVSTDQDNALIFESGQPEQDRGRWLAFARQVNDTLDACGYPLCQGGIMAGTPQWCHTLQEWQDLAAQWIERGSPQDLLQSAVLFDLRALAGRSEATLTLQQHILQLVGANPRFLRQWVENHLQTGVALGWHGGLVTQGDQGREFIDVKLSGTAIVVDAARILALSCGLTETSTAGRLQQAGRQLGIPEAEYEGWVTAFHYLQTLRLKQQILAPAAHALANQMDVGGLNMVDRQMLKAAFRAIRVLQQRLRLDYIR